MRTSGPKRPIARVVRCACLALPALAAAAAYSTSVATTPALPLANHLRDMCAHLQQQGWTAPKDSTGGEPASVFDIPGVAYFCNVQRTLAGVGPGHAPMLQALISDSGHQPSVIFSASIWCAADRDALAALAVEIERQLAASALPAPVELLAAAREGRRGETVSQGLRFTATPVDVDAQACSKVPENSPGAVLMKIDVAVEPADAARR